MPHTAHPLHPSMPSFGTGPAARAHACRQPLAPGCQACPPPAQFDCHRRNPSCSRHPRSTLHPCFGCCRSSPPFWPALRCKAPLSTTHCPHTSHLPRLATRPGWPRWLATPIPTTSIIFLPSFSEVRPAPDFQAAPAAAAAALPFPQPQTTAQPPWDPIHRYRGSAAGPRTSPCCPLGSSAPLLGCASYRAHTVHTRRCPSLEQTNPPLLCVPTRLRH